MYTLNELIEMIVRSYSDVEIGVVMRDLKARLIKCAPTSTLGITTCGFLREMSVLNQMSELDSEIAGRIEDLMEARAQVVAKVNNYLAEQEAKAREAPKSRKGKAPPPGLS